MSQPPNGISIGLAVSAQLAREPKSQTVGETDRSRYVRHL